eukprot:TRINITY_DN4183_c0_g2_i1.p1 TRINITY_DN4183_c0_g2~~TRINITY_DN4183_c0_g2_i1.p1  ORF type:complete len:275 (+),score=62.89 TRINITY_DN4183_c0_g2_i1:2-826(+)
MLALAMREPADVDETFAAAEDYGTGAREATSPDASIMARSTQAEDELIDTPPARRHADAARAALPATEDSLELDQGAIDSFGSPPTSAVKTALRTATRGDPSEWWEVPLSDQSSGGNALTPPPPQRAPLASRPLPDRSRSRESVGVGLGAKKDFWVLRVGQGDVVEERIFHPERTEEGDDDCDVCIDYGRPLRRSSWLLDSMDCGARCLERPEEEVEEEPPSIHGEIVLDWSRVSNGKARVGLDDDGFDVADWSPSLRSGHSPSPAVGGRVLSY